jgi:chorismate mutase / prephenate dehydratase
MSSIPSDRSTSAAIPGDTARDPAGTPGDVTPELAALRAELDQVDDALHDLLMRRYAIVARLASSRSKGNGPALRPGREAEILRRLLSRHGGALPKPALVRIWREVLGASTAMQGVLTLAAFAPDPAMLQVAREHFGASVPLRVHPTPARALAAVTEGEASVALLPAPEESEPPEACWWPSLDVPRLQVVARLPFLRASGATGPEALLISPLPPDPTAADRTLLRIEDASGQSRARLAQAFPAAGLPAPRSLILRRDVGGDASLALAEIDGFLLPGDPALAALPFRAWPIGAYAVPEGAE